MAQGKTAHTGSVASIPAGVGDWKEFRGDVYRCRVHLQSGAQGSFVATAAGLTNVSGTGATETAALTAVVDALRAHGKRPLPESQLEEPPAGAEVRWVVVSP